MTKTEGESVGLTLLGAVTLLIVSIVGRQLASGIVVSILWNWFAVPVLRVPQLTIVTAIGISLVFSALRGYRPQPDTEELTINEVIVQVASIVFLRPALLILLGWIVKSLI